MQGTKGLMWRALRGLAVVVLLCLAVFVVASHPPTVLGRYCEPEDRVKSEISCKSRGVSS